MNRMAGPLGSFISDTFLLVSKLLTQHRILIDYNFNLHQTLPWNFAKVDSLIPNLNYVSPFSIYNS